MDKKEQNTVAKDAPKAIDRTLANKSAMLHTYKDDIRDLVKNRKISMVRALAMQSDKKTQLDGDELVTISSREPHSNTSTMFMVISSILMFVLGATAIVIAYNAHQAQLTARETNKSKTLLADDSLIFIEYRTKLDVTDKRPKKILDDLRGILESSNTTLGSITQILLQNNSRTLWQSELLPLLNLSLSEQFTRLLGNKDDYIVGIHIADRNTPFIILTTTSHDHAFAAMLDWEASAEKELRPFFNTVGPSSLTRKFGNIVVQNINARVMRDDSDDIKILYSFLDEQTILITNNINTLTEVARRHKVRKASKANI
ncbi:MAG: hypothetical protein LRZ97_01080 [Candidatus Pacebacteria bacterium]|nr:hypothetical protein [Candidatus Paceibacterota bacterium]